MAGVGHDPSYNEDAISGHWMSRPTRFCQSRQRERSLHRTSRARCTRVVRLSEERHHAEIKTEADAIRV